MTPGSMSWRFGGSAGGGVGLVSVGGGDVVGGGSVVCDGAMSVDASANPDASPSSAHTASIPAATKRVPLFTPKV